MKQVHTKYTKNTQKKLKLQITYTKSFSNLEGTNIQQFQKNITTKKKLKISNQYTWLENLVKLNFEFYGEKNPLVKNFHQEMNCSL